MDILDYLNPIELDRPEDFENWSDDSIIKTIELYTENKSVEDLSEYDVVIIGIPEDRNSRITGSAKSPDVVRNELYKLISHHSIKILDLGNIKNGTTFSDTYVAVREVFHYLLCQNANVIAIGGTQELTVPIYQAFEQYQDKINEILDEEISKYLTSIEYLHNGSKTWDEIYCVVAVPTAKVISKSCLRTQHSFLS